MTDFTVEKEWITQAGLPGVIRLGPDMPVIGQYRCGYVVLPEGHPWRAMDIYDIDEIAEAPGGITWNAEMDDDGQWLCGFDHAHAWDMETPGRATLEFVTAEVEVLAAAASAAVEQEQAS